MCGAATEVVPTCISSLSLAHRWRKTDVNEFNVRNDDQKFIGNTSYQKVKEEKKQVFRLRALRNYYKNKLKTLMEEPTDEQTEEITKVQNKINELTDAINNL